ncbi:MAG: hypothetical protein D6761_04200 [Candidatus Dadabacteria bacterium]|nr:MAG: hypothetical protein D6761_04200 [Candidatus Dadabacteria bacterium]
MKLLKIAGGTVLVLFAAFWLVGLFLPAEWNVQRDMHIEAPVATVYGLVADFRQWPQWSPWVARDPSIRTTYSGPATGVGATSCWEGDPQLSGKGCQRIVAITPGATIETELDFGERGTATSRWSFMAHDGATHVVWSFHGQARSVPERWLGLMIDDWVGADYEDGLRRLKQVAETMPAPPVDAPAETTAPTAATAGN